MCDTIPKFLIHRSGEDRRKARTSDTLGDAKLIAKEMASEVRGTPVYVYQRRGSFCIPETPAAIWAEEGRWPPEES